MARILLIRHGEAAKGTYISDPTLTDRGYRQAKELALKLSTLDRGQLISSPKLRAQQTAEPLAEAWKQEVIIESTVTEIPTPKGIAQTQRLSWIRTLLDGNWDSSDKTQKNWRDGIIKYLESRSEDTIIFCHFMVINSVVAHLQKQQKVRQFNPDYTSITEIHNRGGQLHLVALGDEKSSEIL
ncbi:histidine phosphatase family protein [Microbulbifer sp. SSSA002]|uniref:histidine phosphatase family protein n=1 Tax=unclassified Microbulbifer TaxID=2619833 RepID=UPI00403A1278